VPSSHFKKRSGDHRGGLFFGRKKLLPSSIKIDRSRNCRASDRIWKKSFAAGSRMHRWFRTPPAIRDGFLTLTEARALLAGDPSWSRGLKGDLQMHTKWSDGSNSIQEMAEAAELRGYEYIAVTDHSKGLKIAGGIDEAQLLKQEEEIASFNEMLKSSDGRIRVLRSIELNLDPFGGGDMSEESLARLDLVLGCFHSALRRKEDQTERYLVALRNPSVHILGHPRGRIYN